MCVGTLRGLTVTPSYKGISVVGQKFGNWTVLDSSRKKEYKSCTTYQWQCRCTCGKEQYLSSQLLREGRTKGCQRCCERRGNNSHLWLGFGEVPGLILSNIRSTIPKRSKKLEVNIDCEYLNTLWLSQGRACRFTGIPLIMGKTASVDRIDSNLGYIVGNVQWTHKLVNRAKWEQSDGSFIEMCLAVVRNCGGD